MGVPVKPRFEAVQGQNENFSYLAFVAFFGFLAFIFQPTAYTWGEQDMMPFFERFFDPNFLPNDFFTNTTEIKNPRLVFGYFVVAIAWLTGLDWYKVLYITKLALAIGLPILYFKVLIALLSRHLEKQKVSRLAPFVLIGVLLMVFWQDLPEYFRIAYWLPYIPAMNAFSVSLVFGFTAILLKESGQRSFYYLMFFSLSCLMHPASGIFCMGFYFIFLTPHFRKEISSIGKIFMVGMLSAIVVKLLFGGSATLSADDFITYYAIERHPWHYHLADYNHRFGDWKYYFLGINILFIIPLVYGLLRKRKNLALMALIAWLCYSFSVGLQYFFIDVYPVKWIAYLGPSRFTTFGYWMLLVLWPLMASDGIRREDALVFPSIGKRGLSLVLLNCFFIGLLYMDNPKENNYNEQKALYDFMATTPTDAVFISHSTSLNIDLRLIGRRSVFVGKEFPFAESEIKNYYDRFVLTYGSRRKGAENPTEYYRTLEVSQFLAISKKYQLNYIIVENGFTTKFKPVAPAWKGKKLSAYAIKDFR